MIIESIPMIDRIRRAHIALITNCLQEQQKEETTAERYVQLETEIFECEKMVKDCETILKNQDHGK